MAKIDMDKVKHIRQNLASKIRTEKELKDCGCKECTYVLELKNGEWMQLTNEEKQDVKALSDQLDKVYDGINNRLHRSREYTKEQLDNKGEFGTPLYYLSCALMELENIDYNVKAGGKSE